MIDDDALKQIANGEAKKPSQATTLIDLAQTMTSEFFHDPTGGAYARVRVREHLETWPLRTRPFKGLLSRAYYEARGGVPNAQALQDALGVLDGIARFEGEEHPVHVRVGDHEGAIYLDLGSSDWSVVKVTPDGWGIPSADPPIRFRRPGGMGELPRPSKPAGPIASLRAFLNVASEADFTLLVAWLVNALRPQGPYPNALLQGEQGSAKSTASKVLRALIDPNLAPVRAEPREPRDVAISASNNWVIALDNVSTLSAPISDALCSLMTGGGFVTRQLYSDSDEVIFQAQRPVISNGIEDFATRSDFLDRSIPIVLPTIPEAERTGERIFWRGFEGARPEILGALLDAVVRAQSDIDTVELDSLPRMADFAEWVTAASPAFGWLPGRFLDAYAGNRREAHEITLDAAAIVPALREVGDFEGTATDLLTVLSEHVDDAVVRRRDWPKSARALGGHLRRLAPNLRAIGMEIDFTRDGSRRLVRIRRESSVTNVTSVTAQPQSGDASDADDGTDGNLASASGARP